MQLTEWGCWLSVSLLSSILQSCSFVDSMTTKTSRRNNQTKVLEILWYWTWISLARESGAAHEGIGDTLVQLFCALAPDLISDVRQVHPRRGDAREEGGNRHRGAARNRSRARRGFSEARLQRRRNVASRQRVVLP